MYSLCYYFSVTSFYILLSPTNSRDLRICANWVWRIFFFEYEFVTVVCLYRAPTTMVTVNSFTLKLSMITDTLCVRRYTVYYSN